MSQVDDWSDGYTSDYLRDLNTYGPASANVPRSSVVSHRVQYRAPDTSDIPLAPGQNPEGSVYSNASGASMGQTKSASGYNPPAGGGYTAQTFPSSGAGAKRYARPKPAVKKKTQSASKQRTQPEYRTGGARTPEENEITRSAAEHRTGADLGQLSSQALDAAARFRSALKLLGFGAGAGSADTASTDVQQDDIDRAYDWTATGNAGTGGFSPERPMIDSSDAASGIPPEIMARLKKDADDGSPWGLLPWALGPTYKPIAGLLPAGQKIAGLLPAGQKLLPAGQKLLPAGQKLLPYNGEAAAGAVGSKAGEAAAGESATGAGSKSSFGFDLSAEDVAAANAANAAAKQQAVNLSEMRTTLMRAGMPDREIEAYMHGAGFYNDPEALRQAIDVVRKHGMAGLFEHSAAEAAAARAGSAAGTGAGSAAGTGSRGSFRFDLSPEEIASAKASHDAYVRGAAGAADGGVSKLAEAGNVGRETAAGAATGSVSEGVDSASQQLIQHIRSGTLDEMERAWLEATAAGAAKAPGTIDASTQAILNEARAAGILGRDAAGTAGAADGGVSKLAEAGNVGRETATGEQAASREAVIAARNAAVAKLDPQLQAALANVRKSLANHNISPRQVLQELKSATVSDKDFYEIGRIFFEVGRRTHGAGLSPAEQAVADAYAINYSTRMSEGFGNVGRAVGNGVGSSLTRYLISDIKSGKPLQSTDLNYIKGLAARPGDKLDPDAQALVDVARFAGLIP